MAAFNKVKKNLKKQRKEKEVKLNAFDKFCSLNVKAVMRKTSLTSMLPSMWTTTTVPLERA
eukprot:5481443-Ditylum_brightwellii.AAC.1